MHDITDGSLQISYISRAEAVSLPASHRVCKYRRWDSFVYNLSGACDYNFFDGTHFHVKERDILYLPLGAAYEMDVHPGGYQYIICDCASPISEKRRPFAFETAKPQYFERQFRKLVLEFSYWRLPSRPKSLSVLFQIYGQIVEEFHPCYVNNENKRKVLGAQRFIMSNLADKELSVSYLAQHVNMSEVHFRRLFSELHGVSPVTFISNARIERAKSLMEMPEMRIEDIARVTGYSSASYFATAFKAATGLTPSRYRMQFCPNVEIAEKKD